MRATGGASPGDQEGGSAGAPKWKGKTALHDTKPSATTTKSNSIISSNFNKNDDQNN